MEPTERDCLRSQTVASYEDSFSHQPNPMQPGRTRSNSAGEAASAIGLARAAVEPDDVAHAAGSNLFADTWLREHGRDTFRSRGNRAGFEPREQVVGEFLVGVHLDRDLAVLRRDR